MYSKASVDTTYDLQDPGMIMCKHPRTSEFCVVLSRDRKVNHHQVGVGGTLERDPLLERDPWACCVRYVRTDL